MVLSYQHLYHAGNFADVHKHVVLTLLLQALHKKPAAFCYVETHAGRAKYDLSAPEAQKNREFAQGIGRLYQQTDVPALLADYLAVVRAQNTTSENIAHYPGSPCIAQHFLREHDRMILAERHPQEAPILKRTLQHDKRVAVHQRDGYEILRALLPPEQTRGLVLIDPAYELESDYAEVITAMKLIQHRWRSAMIVVWYPIIKANTLQQWHQLVMQSGLKNILCCELQIQDFNGPPGMKGSGIMIIQPPWQCEETLKQVMPYLANILTSSNSDSNYRIELMLS